MPRSSWRRPRTAAFDGALGRAGIDVDAAIRAGRYLAFDADDLLSKFMVEGMPDARRFRDTIGSVMDYVAQDGREIRVFGEMVAVLCERGEGDAALALEDLWNQLAGEREFAAVRLSDAGVRRSGRRRGVSSASASATRS